MRTGQTAQIAFALPSRATRCSRVSGSSGGKNAAWSPRQAARHCQAHATGHFDVWLAPRHDGDPDVLFLFANYATRPEAMDFATRLCPLSFLLRDSSVVKTQAKEVRS